MPVFSFASHRSHHIYAFLSVLFVFLLKFPKNAKKQLTGRNINAKMQSKLNRLIEARYPSVPPTRPGSRGRERGHRRSAGQCLLSGCWVGREDLPDCHKFFCEALSLAVRRGPLGPVFRIFHEPLGKAVHFFHHSQPAGKTIRRTRRRQS